MVTTVQPTVLVQKYFDDLQLPQSDSYKGQNGKLLIIGGSDLFHAASKWSLDVASKFVDMVFYASVPSNNELVQEAKGEFWNGLVVPRTEIEFYAEQADAILIGPGMTRDENNSQPVPTKVTDWDDTFQVINYLVQKFPDKKWIIDAGALQMIEPSLMPKHSIITPHAMELQMLLVKTPEFKDQAWVKDKDQFRIKWNQVSGQTDSGFDLDAVDRSLLVKMLAATRAEVLILKGQVDLVVSLDESQQLQVVPIAGGNAGMTKGGTGDVLAGVVAALACKNKPLTAAIAASAANKLAAEDLAKTVGPFFNASDLVDQVPKTIWQQIEVTAKF